MRAFKALALLLLLAAPAAAAKPRAEFRDFSQKGADYRPLENLRLAADEVTYAGAEQAELFGKQYPAAKYGLRASVLVQTMCAIGAVNTEIYERFPAAFELFVVEDRDRAIHDSLTRSMYALWSRDEMFEGGRFYDFDIKEDKYVLASVPGSAEEKWSLVVWANGRASKIVFEGFVGEGKGGWGVVDGFVSDNLRLRVGEAEFRAYRYPFGRQKKFTKLYEKGFFSRAAAPAAGRGRS